MEASLQPERGKPGIMLAAFAARHQVRRVLFVGGILIIAVHYAYIAHRRTHQLGDFDVSREFGRRFLARTFLYEGGLHYPYMPSAAMYFAPLALVSPEVGFTARYAAALGYLWLMLRLLHRMVRGQTEHTASRQFVIGALTLALASHYIIRDLDDGGPHVILLALLTGGIYCVWRRRPVLGATWFGLAR